MMKSKQVRGDDKRHVETEENWIAGSLNFLVFLAIAAVAYTDWMVVPNISLGYLYVLPIALSGLINPLPLTIGLAVGCTVLQDLFAGGSDTVPVRTVRDVIALAGFLVVGFLVTLIARQRARLAAEVRRQRDEYEHDLILASQVQRRVLPKPPILPALELAAAMQPAQLLGGDYYDFFQDLRPSGGRGDCRRLRPRRCRISADAVAGGGPAPARPGIRRTGGDYQGPG